MDLCLELGMTVGQLKAVMTEPELCMWSVYAERKRLPTRRLELYLAQVAQSNVGGTLDAWMISDRIKDLAIKAAKEAVEPKQEDVAMVAAETIAEMSAGGVRGIRRVGRKKKVD